MRQILTVDEAKLCGCPLKPHYIESNFQLGFDRCDATHCMWWGWATEKAMANGRPLEVVSKAKGFCTAERR